MDNRANTISHFIDWGVVSQPIPGEVVSGDSYIVKIIGKSILIAVIDGLGHGIEAAAAAQEAVECIKETQEISLIAMVQKCHKNLKKTRGVVMSLVMLDFTNYSVEWLGVGNIEAMIVHIDKENSTVSDRLLLRGGVIGYNLPHLQSSHTAIHQGDVLLLATDGIKDILINDLLKTELIFGTTPQKIAERIFSTYRTLTDDALVWVGCIQRA